VPAIFILRKTRKEIIVCFFFIIISVGFLVFGNLKYNQFNIKPDIKNNFIIRAVSPNISLDRFYSKQEELKIIQELITLSSPEKKEPMIFIWPEGIIPDSYLRDMSIYKELFLNSFGNDDLIIMGLNSVKTKNSKNLFFNSMAVFNNKLDLIHSYNKINLVPFGEFTPFEKVLGLIGVRTVTNDYQSFSKGENPKVLSIKNDKIELKLLPLICYEIIYSNRLFKDKKFDYIINISEDGWFGNSIGPKQHFAHSIFRSIESGKYVIRSANNGISGIINPIGIIEKKVEFGTTGYVDFKENKILKSTIYMNYGDKIFFILILLYIFLIFSFKKITHE